MFYQMANATFNQRPHPNLFGTNFFADKLLESSKAEGMKVQAFVFVLLCSCSMFHGMVNSGTFEDDSSNRILADIIHEMDCNLCVNITRTVTQLVGAWVTNYGV